MYRFEGHYGSSCEENKMMRSLSLLSSHQIAGHLWHIELERVLSRLLYDACELQVERFMRADVLCNISSELACQICYELRG